MKKQKLSLNKLQLKKDTVMDLNQIANVKGGDGATAFTVCGATCIDGTCGSQVPQESGAATRCYSVHECDVHTVSGPIWGSIRDGKCGMTDPVTGA